MYVFNENLYLVYYNINEVDKTMSENVNRAFHPGFYLKEYLDELQLSQDEFAKKLGISNEKLSLILSEKANLTVDIANKLSELTGTSTEMWINLQTKYDTFLEDSKN